LKFPTIDQALDAVDMLANVPGSVGAAAGLVNIVVDMFTSPRDQDTLKARYEEVKARTDAALDRLDQAIVDAKKSD
jgi:hypothetical protein